MVFLSRRRPQRDAHDGDSKRREAHQDNLDDFGQEPKAYDAEVFVPATSGVPDTLPSNFTRFTINIADLTPMDVIRLAGLKSADSNTMRRIGQALSNTIEDNDGVGGSSNVSRTTPKSWRRRSRSPNYGTTSSTRMIKAIVN